MLLVCLLKSSIATLTRRLNFFLLLYRVRSFQQYCLSRSATMLLLLLLLLLVLQLWLLLLLLVLLQLWLVLLRLLLVRLLLVLLRLLLQRRSVTMEIRQGPRSSTAVAVGADGPRSVRNNNPSHWTPPGGIVHRMLIHVHCI